MCSPSLLNWLDLFSSILPWPPQDHSTPFAVTPTRDGPTQKAAAAASALKGRAASTSAMSPIAALLAALPVPRGISHVGFNAATCPKDTTTTETSLANGTKDTSSGPASGQLSSLGTYPTSTQVSLAANPDAGKGAKGGAAGYCPQPRAPMGLRLVVLTEDLADELMARERMAKAAAVARQPEQKQQRAEEKAPVQQPQQTAELGFGFQRLPQLPPLPQMLANQQRDEQEEKQKQQQGEAVIEVPAEVRQPAAALGRGHQPLLALPLLQQMLANRQQQQQQEEQQPQQQQPQQQMEPVAEVREQTAVRGRGVQLLSLLRRQARGHQPQELPPSPPPQQQRPAPLQETQTQEPSRDPAPKHSRRGHRGHRGHRSKAPPPPPPPPPSLETDEQLAAAMAGVVVWHTKTTAPYRPGLLNQLHSMESVQDLNPVNGGRVYKGKLPAAPTSPGSDSAASGPAPGPTRVAVKVARSLWVSRRRLARWVQHGGQRASSRYCPLRGDEVKRALGELTANAAVLQRLRERPDTGLNLVPVLCFDMQPVARRGGSSSGSSGSEGKAAGAAAAAVVAEEEEEIEFELVVVMEWAERGSLTAWFDRHLKAADAARGWDWAPLFAQLRRIGWLPRGLRRAGIVLPDLKFDNIVLLANGELALIDVEGAVVVESGREGQGVAVALRTDRFAAPEMFCNQLSQALAVLEQLAAAEQKLQRRRKYLDLLSVQQPARLQEPYGVQLVAEVAQLQQQRDAAKQELLVLSASKGGLFMLAGWVRALPEDVLQGGVAVSAEQAAALQELGVEGCRDDGFEGSAPRAYDSSHTFLVFRNLWLVLSFVREALALLQQQRQGGGVCVGAEEGERLRARDQRVLEQLQALVDACCQVVPSQRLTPEQVVARVEGIACRALGQDVWEEELALL